MSDHTRVEQVLKIIEERDIKYLLHFTHIDNLDSILEHGLIPRANLGNNLIRTNDKDRHDATKDANCMSISFPNYRMFLPCRGTISGENWVVLVFDAKLLANKDCAFCYTNAASDRIRFTSLESRKSVDALKDMFFDKYEDGDEDIRKQLNIPSYYTTDPQAEVLLFDIIKPTEILGIAVSSNEEVERLRIKHPNTHFQHIPEVFTYRKDFSFWRS